MGILIVAGVAVIVLVVAQRGAASQVSGYPQGSTSASRGVSTPWTGANYNPLSPVSSSMISAGMNGGASIAQASIANGASGGTLSPTEAAGATAAVGAGIAIIGALLAQHQARLKGATNENNAALQIVPSFDSFLQTVVSLVNTGKVSKPQAAASLAQYDQALYAQLRGLVSAPGTAWNDAAGYSGKCDKTCTVSCCLYYSDLGPPLSLVRYLLGDTSGKWGSGDPRLSGNTVTVPQVYPGKYSKFSRKQYTLTIN